MDAIFLKTVVVRKLGGCLVMTIPQSVVKDMDITPGETLSISISASTKKYFVVEVPDE
jgi:antitoxin component of MazEF toxin-antitoxin module